MFSLYWSLCGQSLPALNGTFGRHPYHLGRCLFFITGTESPSIKTFGGKNRGSKWLSVYCCIRTGSGFRSTLGTSCDPRCVLPDQRFDCVWNGPGVDSSIMCSPFCEPNRLPAYRKRDWFFWFDEKPWKDLWTDSRRVARVSSSDFLDALVAFRTFDYFFTHHVLFIDGAQRNSANYGLNFFEPKISEISLLNFFFSHTWKSWFSPSLSQNFIA